jgi:hypothetical protein
MIDHSGMKLGKLAPRKDKRTLKMADYIVTLPPVPAAVDWSHKLTALGEMCNDKLGDCTCAAAGHAIQTWTGNVKNEVTPTDKQIVAAYSAITGYTPRDPNSDQGAVELDVLNYWRNKGVGGHKISSYMAVQPKNQAHVKASIFLFGGTYCGLALPNSAQTQDVWDVVPGPDGAAGSWGGHAVWGLAYDSNFLTFVTWGELKKMTWRFWNAYCDESYALLSSDWFTKKLFSQGPSPSGFDMAALAADLKAL